MYRATDFADNQSGGTAATGSPGSTKSRNSQVIAAFTISRTDWQLEAERRLCQVIRLKRGWDGYQGHPVNPTIAEYAYRLLETLLRRPGVPLPSITPLSYGGLILEWHRKGWDVEIEIDAPSSHIVYTHELASEVEEHFQLGTRLDRLSDVIGKIAN